LSAKPVGPRGLSVRSPGSECSPAPLLLGAAGGHSISGWWRTELFFFAKALGD